MKLREGFIDSSSTYLHGVLGVREEYLDGGVGTVLRVGQLLRDPDVRGNAAQLTLAREHELVRAHLQQLPRQLQPHAAAVCRGEQRI